MNIPINDDFDHSYKIEAWKGFDVRELMSIAVGLLISVLLAGILYYYAKLQLILSFYIGIIPAVPLMILSFWRSRLGMTLPEHMEAIRYHKATSKLIYSADEMRHGQKQSYELEEKILREQQKYAEYLRSLDRITGAERRAYIRYWKHQRKKTAANKSEEVKET